MDDSRAGSETMYPKSSENVETSWKLMKIDENWKSCKNWKNRRGQKIESNCIKLEKLDEIAEIG